MGRERAAQLESHHLQSRALGKVPVWFGGQFVSGPGGSAEVPVSREGGPKKFLATSTLPQLGSSQR